MGLFLDFIICTTDESCGMPWNPPYNTQLKNIYIFLPIQIQVIIADNNLQNHINNTDNLWVKLTLLPLKNIIKEHKLDTDNTAHDSVPHYLTNYLTKSLLVLGQDPTPDRQGSTYCLL